MIRVAETAGLLLRREPRGRNRIRSFKAGRARCNRSGRSSTTRSSSRACRRAACGLSRARKRRRRGDRGDPLPWRAARRARKAAGARSRLWMQPARLCRKSTARFENSAAGRHLLLAGDAGHPEVQGILGCCRGRLTRSQRPKRSKNVLCAPRTGKIPVFFCQQTTFNVEEWEKCLFFIKRYVQTLPFLIQYVMRPRIVSRRRERSAQSDLMLVVGGRQSSNTAKLRDGARRPRDVSH